MRKMNRHGILFATTSAIFLLAAHNAQASEPFGPGAGKVAANIGLFSDYRFRGISQSDEGPAVQGGLDYSHDSGLYLGTWASSVDFNDGDEAQAEIDLYGGWTHEFTPATLTFGGIYYWYPTADDDLDYDYVELMIKAAQTFGKVSGSVSVNYSPDYFASSGNYWYPAADVSIPLPKEFTLTGHIGYNNIDDEARFGSPDYWDYSIGIGYNFYGVDTSLQYIDTNLDQGIECIDGCGESIVFGIKKSF